MDDKPKKKRGRPKMVVEEKPKEKKVEEKPKVEKTVETQEPRPTKPGHGITELMSEEQNVQSEASKDERL